MKDSNKTSLIIALVIALSLGIVIYSTGPLAFGSTISEDPTSASETGALLKKLSQPVAFEFECEPLTDIVKFLRTVTSVNILVDSTIFEKLGKHVDCHGNEVNRRDIFITMHVSETPLETVLNEMLGRYGLAFSVQRDFIYISTPDVIRNLTPFKPEYVVENADLALLKMLDMPTALEFECEPLRDVLRFMATTMEINILVDENVFEELGEYEDCFGKKHDSGEIFITIQASELSLQSVLSGMLRPHGLAFSVERDFIYITTPAVLRRSSFPE